MSPSVSSGARESSAAVSEQRGLARPPQELANVDISIVDDGQD